MKSKTEMRIIILVVAVILFIDTMGAWRGLIW